MYGEITLNVNDLNELLAKALEVENVEINWVQTPKQPNPQGRIPIGTGGTLNINLEFEK